jgi:hypothetical protein
MEATIVRRIIPRGGQASRYQYNLRLLKRYKRQAATDTCVCIYRLRLYVFSNPAMDFYAQKPNLQLQ